MYRATMSPDSFAWDDASHNLITLSAGVAVVGARHKRRGKPGVISVGAGVAWYQDYYASVSKPALLASTPSNKFHTTTPISS